MAQGGQPRNSPLASGPASALGATCSGGRCPVAGAGIRWGLNSFLPKAFLDSLDPEDAVWHRTESTCSHPLNHPRIHVKTVCYCLQLLNPSFRDVSCLKMPVLTNTLHPLGDEKRLLPEPAGPGAELCLCSSGIAGWDHPLQELSCEKFPILSSWETNAVCPRVIIVLLCRSPCRPAGAEQHSCCTSSSTAHGKPGH